EAWKWPGAMVMSRSGSAATAVSAASKTHPLSAGQFVRMLFDLPNGFGDLVHIAAGTEQLGLCEPHSFAAQAIVGRALVALLPVIQKLFAVDFLVAARRERVSQERLLVQRIIASRSRDTFRAQRF